jgi:meiotically up-regulated gene 157 (Mug157) protein
MRGIVKLILAAIVAWALVQPASADTQLRIVLPLAPPRTVGISVSALFETLNRDFFPEDDGTVYVQTGDIPAMWLRDSSAQARPYVRFGAAFPDFAPVCLGIIERNAKNVMTDSYANAFTAGYKVWEEKWEVDSLAYPVTLAWQYWQSTRDRRVFTPRLQLALARTLDTYGCEQDHHTCSDYTSVYLMNNGVGADFADTGMIWGAFRPSDDPVRYPFNIPQQMLAAVALDDLAQLEEAGFGDQSRARRAREMAGRLRAGIERYGTVYDFRYGWIYAYEVDGLGNAIIADDANLPNLISATYFGFTSTDNPIYRNTRRFALSSDNPYFYRGQYAQGLGSYHTRTGWVWPLGLIARALTAPSSSEVAESLAQLRSLSGPEATIHESVDPDHPSRFTRSQFGWGDALYAELLFRSVDGLPDQSFGPERPFLSLRGSRTSTPQLTSLTDGWENSAATYEAMRRLGELVR